MEIRRAMPVLVTEDPGAAREFYVDYLGFRVGMDQPGLLMLVSTSTPTTQLIVAWETPDALDPDVCTLDVSIEVADVDAAWDEALAGELEIVRPIRDEPWGIRRFFVRDPAGHVLNIASHIA